MHTGVEGWSGMIVIKQLRISGRVILAISVIIKSVTFLFAFVVLVGVVICGAFFWGVISDEELSARVTCFLHGGESRACRAAYTTASDDQMDNLGI